jgi:hypothetical protein
MPLPKSRISNKQTLNRKGQDIPLEKLQEKKYRVYFAPDYLIIEKIKNVTVIYFRGHVLKFVGYPPRTKYKGRYYPTSNHLNVWEHKYATYFKQHDWGGNLIIRCRVSLLDNALMIHFIQTNINVKLFSVFIDRDGRRVKFKYLNNSSIMLWDETGEEEKD